MTIVTRRFSQFTKILSAIFLNSRIGWSCHNPTKRQPCWLASCLTSFGFMFVFWHDSGMNKWEYKIVEKSGANLYDLEGGGGRNFKHTKKQLLELMNSEVRDGNL